MVGSALAITCSITCSRLRLASLSVIAFIVYSCFCYRGSGSGKCTFPSTFIFLQHVSVLDAYARDVGQEGWVEVGQIGGGHQRLLVRAVDELQQVRPPCRVQF